MKSINPIILVLLISATAFSQETVIFNNPSFEGTPAPHVVPAPWNACFGSPDTQPGTWGINHVPSNGNTYLSFLHGGDSPNGYSEGASQLLPQCLTAGQFYQFTIDAAFSSVYETAEPADCYGSLQVLGGTSLCDDAEVLWQSGMINNTSWNTFTVSFVPSQNWCYLTFRPYLIDTCSGYINCMIDNINSSSDGNSILITSPIYLSQEQCGFLVTGVTDTAADEIILTGGFIGSPISVNATSDTTWEQYVSYSSDFTGNDEIYATAYFDNYFDTSLAWVTVVLDSCSSGHRIEITSPGNNSYQSCGFIISGLTDSVPSSILLEGDFTGAPLNAQLLTDTTWQQFLYYPYGYTGTDSVFATAFFPNDTVSDWVIINLGNNTLALQQLCVVTVDSVTDKNLLVWEKEITASIDYYAILKETNQNNVYAEIGLVAYDSLSIFIDTLSNPFQNANKYKIEIVDTCGLRSVAGTPHKTIHLSINIGLNNVINLAWNQYEGLPILTYNIYRGQTPENVTLLTSLPSNIVSFTDNFPILGVNYYYVEAVLPDSCTPFRDGLTGSLSNYTSQLISSVNQYDVNNSVNVFPNPNNGSFIIESNIPENGKLRIEVRNIIGQLLYAQDDNAAKGIYRKNIDMDLAKGIYLITLQTNEGSVTKKVEVVK